MVLKFVSAPQIDTRASLGVKMDAIPGRLNETYFSIKEPGMYFLGILLAL